MISTRCPICDRVMEAESHQAFPHLPFCSSRCKTIDLGRWLGEKYRITVSVGEPPAEDGTDDEEFPQAGRSYGRST